MKKRSFVLVTALILSLSTACDFIRIDIGSNNGNQSSNNTSTSDKITSNDINSELSSGVTSNSLSHSSGNSTSLDNITLDIISINDLHGYAYESSNNSNINLANTAYYVDSIRNKYDYDNVLLVANGDMFQGTAFSNLSYGKSVINAMNEMNFDFMGIGNHEFDWGLDKVLNYFDNDESNGEANFPLINGNIRYTKDNTRVGEESLSDRIEPYTIIEKAGINVGILSYIGPLKNDINQNKMKDYYIDLTNTNDQTFYAKVKSDALALKELGADIIVLNAHNGSSEGVEYDQLNNNVALLKDSSGNYLIDAVINGHTHSAQSGAITRENGLKLPIVQGGSYGNAIGKISFAIDAKTKKITSIKELNYYYVRDLISSTNNKNQAVQNVLDSEYKLIEKELKEVFTYNKSSASRNQVGSWCVNVMKKYADADIALINTGGIRSSLPSGNITISELYQVNPFDNCLEYVSVLGKNIKDFYEKQGSYYYFDEDFNVSEINDNQYYKLITIDYVFYSVYFKNSFTSFVQEKEEESLCARDLLKLDLIAKGGNVLDLSSSREASLATNGWCK